MKIISSIAASFGHLLWPYLCLRCGRGMAPGDGRLCSSCWGELLESTGGSYCRRCGRSASIYSISGGRCPACSGEQIGLAGTVRAGVYRGVLRELILAFKLAGRTEFLPLLGSMAASALAGSGFADEIELFVPVPLHPLRRLRRGYNQSMLISRGLSRHCGARLAPDLVRVRRTASQTSMSSPRGRRLNVAGAFGVRRDHRFTGRRVCIVDDVRTTGATLDECSRTLLAAGASRVYALVLATAEETGGS